MTDAQRTVYIAGPMTGLPDYNYPAFNSAASLWRFHGWKVANPAENFGGRTDLPYETYIEQAMKDIETVDAVAVLDGWAGSKGARMEIRRAVERGIPVYKASHASLMPHSLDVAKLKEILDIRETVPVREASVVLDFSGAVDGNGYKASMDDPAKPHLALVPSALINAAGRSFTYGAKKYAPNNWRRGMPWSEAFSALQRHLTAWNEGEDIDPGSGLNHLDNACASLAFLCEYVAYPELYGKFDNRFKRPSAPEEGE